ncbi:hypothetical protein AGMMS50267_17220 [Spirochaetia bacterium]|nr:hypothetical protein AGMMS50267_17220 [Spirochaetia bacterium]
MKSGKGKDYRQILPQLNNCNMIANHWAKELLTIFVTCIKEWKENQHIKVKISEWKYEQHLQIERGKEYSLVISSSGEILKNDDDYKGYTPDTLIFISTATADEAVIFFWAERDKPLCTIKKNKNDFSITSNYKEEIIHYRKFKHINLRLTEIGKFTKSSLAYQGLNKTRSKGGKISNQNSDVQSARKKEKLVKGSAVRLFGNNIFDLKTMKDAHKFVASEYDYTKSYRTFVRKLKKGNVIEFKKNSDVLQVSLMEI